MKVTLKLRFEGQGASCAAELGSESGPSGLKESRCKYPGVGKGLASQNLLKDQCNQEGD